MGFAKGLSFMPWSASVSATTDLACLRFMLRIA